MKKKLKSTLQNTKMSFPGCLQPGSSVTVTVVVNVPLPLPDFMKSWTNKSAVTVRSAHTTPYGDYRAAG